MTWFSPVMDASALIYNILCANVPNTQKKIDDDES